MAHRDEQLRRSGNITAIMDGFMSDGALYRFQAICGAVNHNVFNDAVKNQLIRLVNDGAVIMGYSVSQLAIAALDKFGVKQYTGDDETTKELIKAEKWFDR